MSLTVALEEAGSSDCVASFTWGSLSSTRAHTREVSSMLNASSGRWSQRSPEADACTSRRLFESVRPRGGIVGPHFGILGVVVMRQRALSWGDGRLWLLCNAQDIARYTETQYLAFHSHTQYAAYGRCRGYS